MTILFIALTFLILALSVRTLLWHLQSWQIREYRFDRMRSHLQTSQGFLSLFTLWFKPGILPRPKKSSRILLMALVVIMLAYLIFLGLLLVTSIQFTNTTDPSCLNKNSLYECIKALKQEQGYLGFVSYFLPAIALITLLNERLIWLYTATGVLLTNIPVKIQKRRTFRHAQRVIEGSHPNLIKIGISGSFGKSSTKEILYHILTSEYGEDAVLYNPGNHNNELAIARLIIQNRAFFLSEKSKVFLFETGAYKRGEICQITDAVKPEIGILTGLNEQHIELFGSIRNIQLAEFELAESCTKKVFFNSDNELTADIFADKEIEAVKIPISQTVAENVKAKEDSTTFEVYGEKFTLPWPGEFFVQNALLCLETARELGISPKKLAEYLPKLPTQKRALHTETRKLANSQTCQLLFDLYSQNPDGTTKAIEHLAKAKGEKIFIGMPLLELGKESKSIHEQIFSSLKDIDATVYWLKKDHKNLGKKIIGDKFHSINTRSKKNIEILRVTCHTLETDTTILLEGRIPQNVLSIFETKD